MAVTTEEEEQEQNNNNNKKKTRRYKINNKNHKNLIGLALLSPEKIKEIAMQGALSPHQTRGLQAASLETRKRVASRKLV